MARLARVVVAGVAHHVTQRGNRISVIDAGGTTSYTTNALNQYTAVGGVTYVYDDNGNLRRINMRSATQQFAGIASDPIAQ
ncbi:MAG: hypothetical protein ABFE13_27930 [Phycisphaerales bacterium]